nr:hypothetical protein [Tanacetum cinerariifolium]GEV87962.1 hypothetical protein [Tanacetum cinerariifolium]
MHNNIMADGSRDRPSMLATGRYPQWHSQFLRYIDTRPNGEALWKCILSGPYKPTTVLVQAVEAANDSPVIPEHTTVETPMNMTPENKAHFEAEKEAIHLILTGIGDEIYSTVYACQTTQEMWEAIERLARNANPLALVATAQANQDPHYQTSRSHKSHVPSLKPSILNRSHTTTRHKGKEIAKQITPPSKTTSEEDSDPKQAQRDKDMQKNLALIAKYFKMIYKHTNNNLRTSSNFRNKNVNTTLRYKNGNQSGQFGNQRTVNVAGARENTRMKKLMNRNWKHIKATWQRSKSNTCLVETDDSNVIFDSPDMCEDGIQNEQNDVKSDDERVALANLIANLKLDVDENNKIQKQLKKANTTLAQELKQCKTILAETSKSLGKSFSMRDSCLVTLQTKQAEFEKYKAFNDCTVDYDKLERKLNETLSQLALKDIEIKEGLKTKACEILVVKEKHDELMKQGLLTKSHYEGLVKQKTKVITDLKLREEHDIEKMLLKEKQLKFLNEIVYKRSQSIQTIHMMELKVSTYNGRPTFANPRLILDGEETLALERESQSKLNKDLVRPYDYNTLNNVLAEFQCLYLHKVKECECLLQKLSKQTESVSKAFHTELLQRFAKVEKHLISLEIAFKKCKENAKHDTVWNEKASNVFRKEREQYFKIQDLKAQLQEKNIAISDLKKLIEKDKGKSTSSTPLCPMAKASLTQAWLWHRRLSHLNFDYINLLSKKDIVIGLPKLKYVKDQLCSSCELSKAKRSSFKLKAVPSSKGRLSLLHMDLCGPMWVASINGKKYILVIVDDYSRYTGTEFLNKTLNAFFKEEGIEHQTSTAQIPKQNGVVERRNRTLVEAARTMLSASKLPLFFWAEAIATACYTQNRSIIISTHEKTPYHIIKDRKPSIKHLYIFGYICYLTRDGENLDKMKEKGDPCILVGYSTQSKGYLVYNKRTRLIVKSVHICFDEFKEVSETSVANDTSGLVPQRQKASDFYNSDPVSQQQDVSSSADENEKIDNQAEEEQLPDDEFTNLFFAPPQDVDKSFLHNIDEFIDPDHPEKVYRLKKALYGLKQAPRAWYDELSKFLTSKGSTKGLQIHQSPRGIFINQAKYTLEILHKHGIEKGQSIGTPMATKPKLDADLSGNLVDQTDYHSKIRSLMYITSRRPDMYARSDKLVSCMSKKQNCTAMSSAEAEYMALSASCAQVMCMRTQLQDYGFNYNKILLYHDFQSAIAISCNPVQHSRAKHIHTRFYVYDLIPNNILIHDDSEVIRWLVLRYDADECDKEIMQTKIELTLEQSQQGVSNDVLVRIEGVEELKRNKILRFELETYQGDYLNLPDHRYSSYTIKRETRDDGVSDSFQWSQLHHHMLMHKLQRHTKHQRFKNQESSNSKTKNSANFDKQELPSRNQVYQGRLLTSFQDDAKYEHRGQDKRLQGGKDDQD